jgi:hypothetical protein
MKNKIFKFHSDEYNEGYESFLNYLNNGSQLEPACPYEHDSDKSKEWKRGADASKTHWNHNAGGDW